MMYQKNLCHGCLYCGLFIVDVFVVSVSVLLIFVVVVFVVVVFPKVFVVVPIQNSRNTVLNQIFLVLTV